MSVVVPVRIPKDLAERINQLVEIGVYSNRSNLMRDALRRFAASQPISTQRTIGRQLAVKLASTIIAWNEKTVTDIILFGSLARGEAKTESDIDLLILTENIHPWKVRQRLYDLIYPIIPVLEVDISLIVMNKETFAQMVKDKDPFANSVINEGIRLHGWPHQ